MAGFSHIVFLKTEREPYNDTTLMCSNEQQTQLVWKRKSCINLQDTKSSTGSCG